MKETKKKRNCGKHAIRELDVNRDKFKMKYKEVT